MSNPQTHSWEDFPDDLKNKRNNNGGFHNKNNNGSCRNNGRNFRREASMSNEMQEEVNRNNKTVRFENDKKDAEKENQEHHYAIKEVK